VGRALAVVAVLGALAGCAAEREPPAASPTSRTSRADERQNTHSRDLLVGGGGTTTSTAAATTTAPSPVSVEYRIEVRSADPAFADFPAIVEATIADARGWSRAGFVLRRADVAPYAVVLAEPDDAQELCRPYDVYRAYSCQNGPLVVLNADRWRHATPEWTGDLATYRQMLVSHEFGHLLGQRHPRRQCPQPGEPAAVMAQQSTELRGCLPNPWPLDWEIALAARHDQPIAPGYGE
jgi:hypothetical protein